MNMQGIESIHLRERHTRGCAHRHYLDRSLVLPLVVCDRWLAMVQNCELCHQEQPFWRIGLSKTPSWLLHPRRRNLSQHREPTAYARFPTIEHHFDGNTTPAGRR